MFVLILRVPVNKLSILSEQCHRFLGIACNFQGVNLSLFKGHTTAEVGIEQRPHAHESETLPLGHCDLRFKICFNLMYMGVAVSFTKQRIAISMRTDFLSTKITAKTPHCLDTDSS